MVLRNALGFVLRLHVRVHRYGGFGFVGGRVLHPVSKVAVNVVCGLVVIAFGLYFLGIIKINLFHGAKNPLAGRQLGFFSSVLFGVIFLHRMDAVRGAFLGSALMLASQRASVAQGVILLTYSQPASVFRS